jgi:hypothetical protein
MTQYPTAPWHLTGNSIQSLRLVEIERVRDSVPCALRIVPVLPGKTLAAVYCGSYEIGSTLVYHELIVAAALVAHAGKLGFWIAEIYVDDPQAQAGGHGIWSLPKQLARFDWAPHRGAVTIEQADRVIARFEWKPRPSLIPIPLWLPVLVQRAARLVRFHAKGYCTTALVPGRIVPAVGSLAHSLGFHRARRLWSGNNLHLRIDAPRDDNRLPARDD